jgi:hypothetical protein
MFKPGLLRICFQLLTVKVYLTVFSPGVFQNIMTGQLLLPIIILIKRKKIFFPEAPALEIEEIYSGSKKIL